MRHEFNATAPEMLTIDNARDEKTLALLRRAYKEVFVPAFPIEDERESLERLETKLKDEQNPNKRLIIIAGRNLTDPAKAEIYAISIAYYYTEYKVGLLAYNAVDPKYRDYGLGRKMVDARIAALHEAAAEQGDQLRAAFLEVNDPEKVGRDDSGMDPAKRVAIFQKWGAKRIPIDYVQPALGPGKSKFRDEMLMAYPVNGKYPTPSAVGAFIDAVYKYCSFGADHTKDEDYIKTMRQIKKWRGFDAKAASATVLAFNANTPKPQPAALPKQAAAKKALKK